MFTTSAIHRWVPTLIWAVRYSYLQVIRSKKNTAIVAIGEKTDNPLKFLDLVVPTFEISGVFLSATDRWAWNILETAAAVEPVVDRRNLAPTKRSMAISGISQCTMGTRSRTEWVPYFSQGKHLTGLPHLHGENAAISRGVVFAWTFELKGDCYELRCYGLLNSKAVHIPPSSDWIFATRKKPPAPRRPRKGAEA